MKKRAILFLAIVLSLGMIGCKTTFPDEERGTIKLSPNMYLNPHNVIVVEGCEYFVVDAYGGFTYVHKGNCKNPIHPENR